jgi:hypothetical protein
MNFMPLHHDLRRTSLLAGLGALTLLSTGCPDSEARFNEFIDDTEELRDPTGDGDGDTGDGDGDGDTGLENMDGKYLFALETSLGPDLPLQFVTTVSNMEIAMDGASATADFAFQPLSLEQGQTLTPREFVGDVLEYPGVQFDADGNYTIDMGTVMVTGEANPVTGSDIVATLQVLGHIVHADAFCGELAGDLSSPLEYDLTGSSFGAIKLMDDGMDPNTLPTTFPYRCDMVPPADTSLPDMTGTFLFALETSLGPDLPLQFATTITFTFDPDGGGATGDFSFQPLSLEQGQSLTPRMFVGEPLVYDGIAFDPDGNFTIDMGTVMVTGEANPVTGSDIVATLIVDGSIVHMDALCGELSGDLSSPLEYDLTGSSFAASRLMDDGSNPDTLPTTFPYKCSMVE